MIAGKRVLVTRPAHQAQELVEKLVRIGADAVVLPAIEILAPDSFAPLDAALRDLQSFDWVVFTSVNGVQAVVKRMRALGIPTDQLASRKLAVVGSSTRAALTLACRDADAMPEEFVSDKIAGEMGDLAGSRVLLPSADIARPELAIDLTRRGAAVVRVDAYRVAAATPQSVHAIARPDYITFASSSAVRATRDALEGAGRGAWLREAPIVCIGPVTADTVTELGLEVGAVARVHTLDGLVAAVAELAREPQHV